MSKILIENLPAIITDDIYFKLNSSVKVNKEDIPKIIENDVNDYINKNVEEYREEFIEELTKDLKVSFSKKYINDYLDKSYLIKLKSSDIDNNTISKCNDSIDKSESNLEIRELYKIFNKTIRKISTDRPNDFNKVINSLRESINDYKDNTNINKEVNETLIELIDDSELKLDKLSTYVKEMTKQFYKITLETMSTTYTKYLNKFIDEHIKEIDEASNKFKDSFKSKYEKEIIKSKSDNIVNLKNFILTNYLHKINFVDCGKELILIFNTKYDVIENAYYFFSDMLNPEIIKVFEKDIGYIKRTGDTFTVVLRKE